MRTDAGPTGGRPPSAGGLESALARVLRLGTYASMALIALGTVLLVLGGGSPMDAAPLLDLGRIPGDVLAGRPEGFLWLGVLGVAVTPGLRVVGALIGFVRGREWGMAAVAVAILIVVAAGIVAGLVTG